jgi:hypothetical protein
MFFMDEGIFNFYGRKIVDKFIRPAEVRFVATEGSGHLETWLVGYNDKKKATIADLVPRKGNSRSLNDTFLKVFCNEN